jgi:hypothetical protein
MIQEITLAAESEMPIKPLLESAIRSELEKLRLAIVRTKRRLDQFEEKYEMDTIQFKKKYETAELVESLDFIEWFGEIETLSALISRQKALTGVSFVD